MIEQIEKRETEGTEVRKRMTWMLLTLALATITAACGDAGTNSNATNTNSANANTSRTAVESVPGERTGPGNTVITTETTSGVTTETRAFRDANSPVSKVVVTTRDGRRTARVHYRSGEVRELTTEGDISRALDSTADALISAGGKVVDVSKEVGSEVGDKAKDVGSEVGDKAEDVKDQTVKGAKKVGSEAADKVEDVGDKTASGAKKAGKATVKGAKKTGSAIKDAITP